jgi:hypothetical protein
VIQRWWRNVLYAPPDGLFYKRASERFDAASAFSECIRGNGVDAGET